MAGSSTGRDPATASRGGDPSPAPVTRATGTRRGSRRGTGRGAHRTAGATGATTGRLGRPGHPGRLEGTGGTRRTGTDPRGRPGGLRGPLRPVRQDRLPSRLPPHRRPLGRRGRHVGDLPRRLAHPRAGRSGGRSAGPLAPRHRHQQGAQPPARRRPPPRVPGPAAEAEGDRGLRRGLRRTSGPAARAGGRTRGARPAPAARARGARALRVGRAGLHPGSGRAGRPGRHRTLPALPGPGPAALAGGRTARGGPAFAGAAGNRAGTRRGSRRGRRQGGIRRPAQRGGSR